MGPFPACCHHDATLCWDLPCLRAQTLGQRGGGLDLNVKGESVSSKAGSMEMQLVGSHTLDDVT